MLYSHMQQTRTLNSHMCLGNSITICLAFLGLIFLFYLTLAYGVNVLFIFSGKNLEKVCEMCHITVNKTAIFDDNGTLIPGGVRIGEH